MSPVIKGETEQPQIENFLDEEFASIPSDALSVTSYQSLTQEIFGNITEVMKGKEFKTKQEYEVHLANYFLQCLQDSGADFAEPQSKRSKNVDNSSEKEDVFSEKRQNALDYHANGKPGKFEIKPTKAMNTQDDLALAYSPGVAEPCIEIKNNPETIYNYTNKGNMVAVISNGTAVLGLGDIGPAASKPVMEGKAVLFNKFAGVNSIDLCIEAKEPQKFIDVVKTLGPSFGGINLEDLKGPECFEIEDKLKNLMDIPVFHDDQHGTAIVCLAGLINACKIKNKKFEDIKVVVNGAGAAGIACMKLIQNYGAKKENCFLVDSQGVIYEGRKEGMNSYKE